MPNKTKCYSFNTSGLPPLILTTHYTSLHFSIPEKNNEKK